MKTRTLLMLSVGTALMILIAGGVLLLQLSGQQGATTTPSAFGDRVTVGDAFVIVVDVGEQGDVLTVLVDLGGVDDSDGIAGFRLVTGDMRLDPLAAPADGRCAGLTVAAQRCTIDFDVSTTVGSSRVLVVRRGEEQATWRLG